MSAVLHGDDTVAYLPVRQEVGSPPMVDTELAEYRYQPSVTAGGATGPVTVVPVWRTHDGVADANRALRRLARVGLDSRHAITMADEVIRTASRWTNELPVTMPVSEGLMPRAGRVRPWFVDAVADACRTHDFPPERVVVSLPEAAIGRDPERALWTVDTLRRIGCRLAVSRFGVGRSSLPLLSRYGFSDMYIDRSFIGDATTSVRARTVLSHIVSLGHALAMNVIVTGVDSSAEFLMAKESGADLIRGLATGWPATAEEIANIAGSYHQTAS